MTVIVGGEQLDLALGRANKFARFVECGMISQYNGEETGAPKVRVSLNQPDVTANIGLQNFRNIVAQRIKMQGFIIFDYAEKWAEARKQLAQWLSEGKLQRKETILKGGLKVAEEGLLQLFKGQNMGTWEPWL